MQRGKNDVAGKSIVRDILHGFGIFFMNFWVIILCPVFVQKKTRKTKKPKNLKKLYFKTQVFSDPMGGTYLLRPAYNWRTDSSSCCITSVKIAAMLKERTN